MARQHAEKESTMQLAEILSDLVSLRVCDPAASLTFVSARPQHPQAPSQTPTSSSNAQDEDTDLKRAKDLLKYHYEVKEAHRKGQLKRGLDEARTAVMRCVGG